MIRKPFIRANNKREKIYSGVDFVDSLHLPQLASDVVVRRLLISTIHGDHKCSPNAIRLSLSAMIKPR
jgi:hypothetical protein